MAPVPKKAQGSGLEGEKEKTQKQAIGDPQLEGTLAVTEEGRDQEKDKETGVDIGQAGHDMGRPEGGQPGQGFQEGLVEGKAGREGVPCRRRDGQGFGCRPEDDRRQEGREDRCACETSKSDQTVSKRLASLSLKLDTDHKIIQKQEDTAEKGGVVVGHEHEGQGQDVAADPTIPDQVNQAQTSQRQ